jgi:hypothetical protein
MTYTYVWLGALTGWAFWNGCLLGMMIPPCPRPARASLLTARDTPDETPLGTVVALPLLRHPKVRVLHPAPVPETETPRALQLAA